MKLKHLAMAAICAAGISAASAAVAAPAPNSLGLTYSGNYQFASSIATSNAFWTSLTSVYNSLGYGGVESIFESVSGLTAGDLNGLNAVSGGSIRSQAGAWFASINFDNATNKISFASSTLAGGTATLSPPVSVSPVPGPEAGLGVGAVAMAGMAFWMMRRRQEGNLAA